jgi:hypothetical protein
LTLFSRTFKALNTQIRGAPAQNLPLILSILDDLGFAQEVLGRTTVSGGTVEGIRKDILGLEREARGIGGVGVGDVIEDVKRRGGNVVILPSDGGIVDLTIDVRAPCPTIHPLPPSRIFMFGIIAYARRSTNYRTCYNFQDL